MKSLTDFRKTVETGVAPHLKFSRHCSSHFIYASDPS